LIKRSTLGIENNQLFFKRTTPLIVMFEEEEASKKYGNIFIEQEARDYLSQHPSDIQGGQFGPLPLSKQTLGT